MILTLYRKGGLAGTHRIFLLARHSSSPLSSCAMMVLFCGGGAGGRVGGWVGVGWWGGVVCVCVVVVVGGSKLTCGLCAWAGAGGADRHMPRPALGEHATLWQTCLHPAAVERERG